MYKKKCNNDPLPLPISLKQNTENNTVRSTKYLFSHIEYVYGLISTIPELRIMRKITVTHKTEAIRIALGVAGKDS